MSTSEREPHIDLQGRYFDKRVKFFCQPIPQSIQNKTREIVQRANLAKDTRVLDVGSGVGVLIGHFIEQGVSPSNIGGCDLSKEMISQAKENYPKVFFWNGDIVDLPKILPEEFPKHLQIFDRVFFNACFGNMWDQALALSSALSVLKSEGSVVLSHPLGARFVESLKLSDPSIVPHSLPSMEVLEQWQKELGSFQIEEFVDNRDFYFALLTKGLSS